MAKRAVLIDFIGDFKKFVGGSKQAEKAAASFEDRLGAAGRALSLAYGAKKVIDFVGASVKAARDDAAAQVVLANAVRNATGATDAQLDSIEKWITKTQNATGIMDDELRPAYAQLIRVTKDAAETQDLMTLAMDVSRGTGKDLGTVTAALAKAYAGNSTALNRLLPGIKKAGETTLSFADAKERLNAQFQGAAAQYADTDAGKIERLNAQYQDMKETIGAALLPVLGQLVGAISTLFDWFGSLNETQQSIIIGAGLAAAAIFVGVSAFNALSAAVTALGLTMEATMPWLLGIGLVIGTLVAVVGVYGDETDDTAAANQAFNDSVRGLAGGLDLQTLALLSANDAAAQYRDTVFSGMKKDAHDRIAADEDMRDAMVAYGITMQDITGIIDGTTDVLDTYYKMGVKGRERQDVATEGEKRGLAALQAMAQEYAIAADDATWANIQLADSGDVVAIMLLKSSKEWWQLTDAQRTNYQATLDSAAAADKAAKAEDDLTASVSVFAPAAEAATVAAEGTRSKLSAVAQSATDLKAAIDAVFAPYMNMEEANRNLQAAADDLDATLKENGVTMDAGTEKGRANREAVEGQVKAILDYGVAMVGAGASTDDAAAYVNAFTEQLREQLKAAGMSTDEIDAYLTQLGLTPDNVNTTITIAKSEQTKRDLTTTLKELTDIDEGAKAEIQADIDAGRFTTAQQKLDGLTKTRNVPVHVSVSGGGTIDVNARPGGGFKIHAYRGGGNPVAGETALVGEGGPELVTFGAAAHVTPAAATRRALAGAGRGNATIVHVHVAGSVVTEGQLSGMVSTAVRTANRQQRRDTLAARTVPI